MKSICEALDLFGLLGISSVERTPEPPADRNHDLLGLFNRLNRRYFKGKCDASIRWGRRTHTSGRGRRSIHLGTYSFSENRIRLHPALDQPVVPTYVVEAILYHEMLHWYIPPRISSGRVYAHHRLFKRAERQHPGFEKAEQWKNENLEKLLRF
jgi:SprT-like family